MWTLAVYVLVVVAGAVAVAGLGLGLDQVWPTLSVPVSIGLFFAVLWFGWSLTLLLTKRWETTD